MYIGGVFSTVCRNDVNIYRWCLVLCVETKQLQEKEKINKFAVSACARKKKQEQKKQKKTEQSKQTKKTTTTATTTTTSTTTTTRTHKSLVAVVAVHTLAAGRVEPRANAKSLYIRYMHT